MPLYVYGLLNRARKLILNRRNSIDIGVIPRAALLIHEVFNSWQLDQSFTSDHRLFFISLFLLLYKLINRYVYVNRWAFNDTSRIPHDSMCFR